MKNSIPTARSICCQTVFQLQMPSAVSSTTQYWHVYLSAAGGFDKFSTDLQAKIHRLFIEPDVYFNWVRVADCDRRYWNDDWKSLLQECEQPIHRASKMGLFEIVVELLNRGVNPDLDTPKQQFGTALQVASLQGHEKIVQILLDRGADVNAPGKNGSALQLASSRGKESGKIVQMLLERGSDANAQAEPDSDDSDNENQFTALHNACFEGNEEAVKTLLDHGADINAHATFGNTPLQLAASEGNTEIVRILLDRGVDVNLRGELCDALQIASHRGQEEVVQMLLDHGADPNAPEGVFGNALQAALSEEHFDTFEILVDRGANINAQGEKRGVLQMAACMGVPELLEWILDRGADINAEGEGCSALEFASSKGKKETVQLLLDRGAGINAQGQKGTALQRASVKGRESVVRLLLDRGADVNIQGKSGSALQLASTNKNQAIVEMLLDRGAAIDA